LLFAVASGAVVLHVLVDSFAATEPGAARSDHLAAALVPVGVAVVAVLLFGRLPTGAQAALALVFGLLALVAGSLAAVDSASGGPGRDDWTGLLLLPAGAALLGLGAVLAWRSRKGGRWRWARRGLIAIGAVVVAYALVLPVAVGLVATQSPRHAVRAADLGASYEEVALETADGLRLSGWYVPSTNGASVIVFPGRREDPVAHARMLVEHGYGVLLVDMRGQGESEGDSNLYGWDAGPDLDAAVAYLAARPDVRDGRIGGLGLSVGGELLLQAAAADERLRAVVSDGAGWRSLRESGAREHESRLETWQQYPYDAVLTAAVAVLSGDAPPPSLERLVARIAPRPVLLISAENGGGGEVELSPAYARAAGEPKEWWEIPDAGHTDGLSGRPDEYERRVVAFLDDALRSS
jgi:hypothetical protein